MAITWRGDRDLRYAWHYFLSRRFDTAGVVMAAVQWAGDDLQWVPHPLKTAELVMAAALLVSARPMH